jgi:hypothetical protein
VVEQDEHERLAFVDAGVKREADRVVHELEQAATAILVGLIHVATDKQAEDLQSILDVYLTRNSKQAAP